MQVRTRVPGCGLVDIAVVHSSQLEGALQFRFERVQQPEIGFGQRSLQRACRRHRQQRRDSELRRNTDHQTQHDLDLHRHFRLARRLV